MQHSIVTDFTKGSIFKQLIIFAVPFMLSNLLQTLYGTIDTMVVGRFVGSAGLAGVSTGTSLTEIVTHVVMSFATAGQVLISQYIGLGSREKIEKTIGIMMKMIILIAMAFMVLFLLGYPVFLDWMQVPDAARTDASIYMIICSFGFIFVCGYNGICAILRGVGDSRRPFLIIAVAAVTNLVLDLVFVVWFEMGAAGVAIATVISQLESMVVSLVILYRNRESLGVSFSKEMFRRDKEISGLMLSQGIPLALKSAALSGSSLFVASWINSYGVEASAAVAVGRKATMFNSITSQGLMNAGTSMIGQNLGAKKFDRVKKIVRINGLLSLCTFILYSTLYILFIDFLFGLFTTDPGVLAYARIFLPAMIVGLGANAIMIPFFTLVMGSGHAKFNMAISILDGIVLRLGLSMFLGAGLGYGVTGFFWGDNLAALGTAIPSVVFYYSGYWKRHVLVDGPASSNG